MTSPLGPTQPGSPVDRATPSTVAPSISLAAIVILSVGFRFTALFLLRYGSASPDFSDFRYYHELASLSAQGYFPGVQFWSEYPPVFPWIAVAVYRLTLSLPTWIQPYFWFDFLLSSILALADVGSIVAIDRIGDVMGGEGWGRRSALVYAALFAPAFAVLGWFDTLPTFFLLAGLAGIVGSPNRGVRLDRPGERPTRNGKPWRWIAAGLAIGIGVMVKLFPVVALPAVLVISDREAGPDRRAPSAETGNKRYEGDLRRRTMRAFQPFLLTIGGALATILALSAPFLATSPDTFLAGFRNVGARGSWESPWALLDGYYGTGGVASLSDRLFFNASASWGTPARYPVVWWIVLVIAAALYAHRASVAVSVGTPGAAVAIAALGTTFLLLMSRGFSQQFIVWLMPFVALLMPDLVGASLAVILALDTLVLEGYLYVSLFPSLHQLLWVSVAVRTAVLLWLALEFSMAIDPATHARFIARRNRGTRAAIGLSLAFTLVLIATIGPSVAAMARAQFGDGTIRKMIGNSPSTSAVVFTQPTLYDRLAGDVGDRPTTLVAEPRLLIWTGDRSLNAQLESVLANRTNVVVVSEAARPTSPILGAVQEWLLVRYGPPIVENADSISVSTYDQKKRPTERPIDLRFGDGLRLVGISPDAPTVRAGSTDVVSLHWIADRAISKDYTVSTQLLDSRGKLIAQHDAMPVENTMPMTGWKIGENVIDPVAIVVPAGVAPGNYPLIVAVYDHQTLQRLGVTGTGGAGDHAVVGAVAVLP